MNYFTSIAEVGSNLKDNALVDAQTTLLALQGVMLSSCKELPMDLKSAESDSEKNLVMTFLPNDGHTLYGTLNVLRNVVCVGRGNGEASGFEASESDGLIKIVFPHC